MFKTIKEYIHRIKHYEEIRLAYNTEVQTNRIRLEFLNGGKSIKWNQDPIVEIQKTIRLEVMREMKVELEKIEHEIKKKTEKKVTEMVSSKVQEELETERENIEQIIDNNDDPINLVVELMEYLGENDEYKEKQEREMIKFCKEVFSKKQMRTKRK